MKARRSLLLFLALLVFAGKPVAAQDKDKPGVPGQINNEKLLEMLKNLGYESTTENYKSATFYWIKVKGEGVLYSVSAQISPNNEKIWLIVPLADIDADQKFPAERYRRLLELNDQIGPCYFRWNRANKRLYMARAFDNRGVTPASLRDNIERTVDWCVSTRSDWDVSKWGADTKVEAPKDFSAKSRPENGQSASPPK